MAADPTALTIDRRDRFKGDTPEIIEQNENLSRGVFALIIAGHVGTCTLGFAHLTGKEQLEQ